LRCGRACIEWYSHARKGWYANNRFCRLNSSTDFKTDDEAADLVKIRNWYLPEVVLAYNTVLCAGAHMISREHLLRSMELANDVANDKTGLAECFIESGRMRELVIAFAQSSETMLKLNELNQNKRERKNKAGKNLDIWEIKA
jgi:nuclear pore complex protein Nup107